MSKATVGPVRRLRGKALQAVRESEAVSEADLSTGDPDAALVIEIPAGVQDAVIQRVASLLERPTSVDVFDTLIRDLGQPRPGMMLQATLAADRLHALDAEFGLLRSEEIAERAQSPAQNRSALASRWAREGKVFAVQAQGRRLFPAFQFDADGAPLPVIADVITAYGPASGTGLALWCTAPNGHLDGLRPVDLLVSDPEAVLAAAGQARE